MLSECGVMVATGDLKSPVVMACRFDSGHSHHQNNKVENLRLVCPNCHSQTDTYKAKNIGNGRSYRK